MRTEVNINPNIITWAITRAGFDVEQFLNNNPTIEKWIEKIKNPTVKQLEAFANKVHIPFGYLFMPEPPKENIPFPFFRTGNTNRDKVSLNVFDTIQILQRRQDWITDYLLDNEQEPLAFVGKFDENANANTIVENIRETLALQANLACDFATF